MRKQISPLNYTMPLTNPLNGLAVDQFRNFLLQVEQRGLIIGSGSPLGVIEAQQGVEYMDENGIAGAIKWIKQAADIGGDKTLGWVAIG